MKNMACGLAHLAFVFSTMLAAQSAYAIGMGLELSGSVSDESAEWVNDKRSSVSGGISFDIGSHLQLGVTHRIDDRSQTSAEPMVLENGQRISEITSISHTVSNSVNLAIILYNGMVSPYVFFGAEKRSLSEAIFKVNGQVAQRVREQDPGAVNPTWGMGLAIFLNTNFRLKIRQTFGVGYKYYIDQDSQVQIKQAQNQYLEVGIEYKL